jgi:hypothetical protein
MPWEKPLVRLPWSYAAPPDCARRAIPGASAAGAVAGLDRGPAAAPVPNLEPPPRLPVASYRSLLSISFTRASWPSILIRTFSQ